MPEQKLNCRVILRGRHILTMKYSHQISRTVQEREWACGVHICCFDSTVYQNNYNFPRKDYLIFTIFPFCLVGNTKNKFTKFWLCFSSFNLFHHCEMFQNGIC